DAIEGDVIRLTNIGVPYHVSAHYRVPSITIAFDDGSISVEGTGSIGSAGGSSTLTLNIGGANNMTWGVDLVDGDGTLAFVKAGIGQLGLHNTVLIDIGGGVAVTEGLFIVANEGVFAADVGVSVSAGAKFQVRRGLTNPNVVVGAISGDGTFDLGETGNILTTSFSGSSTVTGPIIGELSTLVKAGPGT